MAPRLSILIPAYNEEKQLPACLAAVHAAIATLPEAERGIEVIVCDNNSSDATAALARAHGAQVVFESHNQISRARNAAAAAATGEALLFLDADSWLHPHNLHSVLAALRDPLTVGGGCVIGLPGAPWWAEILLQLWNVTSRTAGWAAGSFVWCRAEAFRAVGGFSHDFYAAEEIDFSRRLKAWSQPRGLTFRVLTGCPHESSARKFHQHSRRSLVRLLLRPLLAGPRVLQHRAGWEFFYVRKE
jgi:glycosyltransferase involved in cell wall biosynthesis